MIFIHIYTVYHLKKIISLKIKYHLIE